jgi:alkanesulfonate monooxygenase SsuD/methylene tetrahydromethanopterin reductase-like flavin-dependent oxidoreductase (luciferase family)
MIKPWVFEFFPAPHAPGATADPAQSADYFNWYLDLWPRAEPLGYEGIFFSEHHFGLTQGRLEIGTAAGIPREMAQVGLSVAEARERNDEAIEILDAALAEKDLLRQHYAQVHGVPAPGRVP